MRGRRGLILLAPALACVWLGCNALLGIETAVFDPDASTVAERAGDSAGVEPEASPPEGGNVDVDASDSGPCTDTQRNPRHCGRCGHDCLGGLCAAGACGPATVATDVGGPFSIAIDATHVYWTNRNSKMIKRAPKGGGPVEIVFSKPGSGLADGLEVRNGEVYFGTTDADGGVLRCAVTGCGGNAPVVVAPLSTTLVDVADGGLLSFSTTANDIYRCTLPCAGGPELVGSSQGNVISVAAAPGQVFWSRIPLELRTKVDGNPIVAIDNGGSFISQMVVVGDDLVYAQLSTGARVALRDGGAKRSLVVGGGSLNTDHVAVRDGIVFFNDFASTLPTGQIFACPMTGCGDGGSQLAHDQAGPRGIAVDDKTVFWANVGENDAGAIMRLAR